MVSEMKQVEWLPCLGDGGRRRQASPLSIYVAGWCDEEVIQDRSIIGYNAELLALSRMFSDERTM